MQNITTFNMFVAKLFINASKLIEKILTFFGMLGAWLAIPLIFVIIFDVISRRFFVIGSTKLQEMEFHLHTALFLLVLGFAYVKNSHVRIEIIRERFPTKLKAWFEVFGTLIFLLPFTGMVIYYGLDFVSRSYNMNEVSAALTGLSHRWIIKSFLPLGMFLLWLAGISVLFRNLAYIIAEEEKNETIMKNSLSISPELKSIDFPEAIKSKNKE